MINKINFLIAFFITVSFSVTAQEKILDVSRTMSEINLLLQNNHPDSKRYNSIQLDNNGNLVIYDHHKTNSNNTFSHSINVEQLSLEKLKVVKSKKKPGYGKNGAQILITSEKGKAVKYTVFNSYQKEYRLSVASQEDGERLVLLLKKVLERYDP